MRRRNLDRKRQARSVPADTAMSETEFAGSIVHEINQPLAAMVTQAASALKWLEQDPPEVREARTSIEKVVWSARRCADMIHGLRSLMVGNGVTRERVDVNALVVQALHISNDVMEFGRDRVVCDLDPDAGCISACRMQLEIVLLNLLSNATKAMEGGAPASILTVRTRRERHGVYVTILDDGHGIGALKPATLFRPFSSTTEGRLGLGLTICRHVIAQHGGRIDIKNVVGGAAVEVRLPDGD